MQKTAEAPDRESLYLYEDLIVAPRQDGEGNAEGYDFHMLPRVVRSLDNIWGNILLGQSNTSFDIVFSGCGTGVGTSFLAFHLAALAAKDYGTKTLYVDVNISQLEKTNIINYKDRPGLISYFTEHADLASLIHTTKQPNLHILSPGRGHQSAKIGRLLLEGERLHEFMATLRNEYPIVIYDCAPVTVSPWSISLCKAAASVVLVASYALSSMEICRAAVDRLRENGVTIVGMIINKRTYPIPEKLYNWLK